MDAVSANAESYPMILPDDPGILEPGDTVAGTSHDGTDTRRPFERRDARRSQADMVVRRLLRIRERPAGMSERAAYSAFQRSMLISAIRCTLTYVIFPFVLPAAGFATGVGPVVGIAIGVVAITCDVFAIRRFFTVDHRWRWQFTAIAGSVICLLLILMVQDIVHLVR